MIDIDKIVRTPSEMAISIAERMKKRRKAMKITQSRLSEISGVSYASIRRFESTGQISLDSLLSIAIALDCRNDFDHVFERKYYRSIQEVIDENN